MLLSDGRYVKHMMWVRSTPALAGCPRTDCRRAWTDADRERSRRRPAWRVFDRIVPIQLEVDEVKRELPAPVNDLRPPQTIR